MSHLNPSSPLPVIFLMGPTASGKTEMAMQLFDHLDGDIISVDSALIYRGMDIGTAKPGPQLLQRYPHHLVDILDPSQSYSAAQFRTDAIELIEQAHARGRVPILVGGTMLYYRALLQGLSPLPVADVEIRRQLEVEVEEHGVAYLHQRLSKVDPESALRIHPNDPQRLQRALEIYLVTGQTMTALWAQASEPLPWRPLKVALAPAERPILHQRIEHRFHRMLEQGLVDEVERLYRRGDLDLQLPSMRCVGYRQVWGYLEGDYDYATMAEKGIVATRQLAKRQMTWLRSESELHWLDGQQLDSWDRLQLMVEEYMRQCLARLD